MAWRRRAGSTGSTAFGEGEEERGGLVDTPCHLHLLDEEAEELVATERRAGLSLAMISIDNY